jgi:hypothetical protein
VDLFDDIVAQTATYLRELWPDELDDVTFEVAGLPSGRPDTAGGSTAKIERWHVDAGRRSVTMYRLPIERLARQHEARQQADAEWEHRVLIEGYVFRAVGDLLGKDPWDLAPDRYRS